MGYLARMQVCPGNAVSTQSSEPAFHKAVLDKAVLDGVPDAVPDVALDVVLDNDIFGSFCALLGLLETGLIYGQFVELAGKRIEALRAAPGVDFIKKEAHSLRGTAGMLGACALAALAGELERTADSADGLPQQAEALHAALAELQAALASAGITV